MKSFSVQIITSEVAEERGRIYDYVARSYLFDLDYGVDNASCSYTVDAGHVGNVAHFINHSVSFYLFIFLRAMFSTSVLVYAILL